PLFIVNSGRDPMYPTSLVDPYIEHFKSTGVNLVYRPQPDAAHDTSWWPEIKDSVERFVADHPRVPLPDALSWESGPPNIPSRAHWMVIERLAAERDRGRDPGVNDPGRDPGVNNAATLPDVHRRPTRPARDHGSRGGAPRRTPP